MKKVIFTLLFGLSLKVCANPNADVLQAFRKVNANPKECPGALAKEALTTLSAILRDPKPVYVQYFQSGAYGKCLFNLATQLNYVSQGKKAIKSRRTREVWYIDTLIRHLSRNSAVTRDDIASARATREKLAYLNSPKFYADVFGVAVQKADSLMEDKFRSEQMPKRFRVQIPPNPPLADDVTLQLLFFKFFDPANFQLLPLNSEMFAAIYNVLFKMFFTQERNELEVQKMKGSLDEISSFDPHQLPPLNPDYAPYEGDAITTEVHSLSPDQIEKSRRRTMEMLKKAESPRQKNKKSQNN